MSLDMEILFKLCCSFLVLLPYCDSITHDLTLIWSEKHLTGSVRLRGIVGDPAKWIGSRTPIVTGQAQPSDSLAQYTSARVALAYKYDTQNIYWSDRNFKEVVKTKLQARDDTPYVYNATHNRVYTGTSSEVDGLAVDWSSGSVYWTDALYNWITVANGNKYDVYRHLITTGLDRPMGIAVDPYNGKMYWSDWGAHSKIEEASLDGTNRKTLVNTDIGKPMGLTVDYSANKLYWLDDYLDTVNIANLDTGDRLNFKVESLSRDTGQHGHLFGIAVWSKYIFLTDQMYDSIRVYDKNTHKSLTSLLLGAGNVPYDIIMYAKENQIKISSDCSILNCQHICVSTGRGKGACLCKEGHILKPNGKDCIEDRKLTQPIFVYTIGHSLCGSRITISDRGQVHPMGDVECFYEGLSEAYALAFDARGEYIYFSDVQNHTISRMRTIEGHPRQEIAANAITVKGMVIDWMAGNIYWTDESESTITIASMDGRYQQILMKNIGKPRGITVNPFEGKIYWADGESNQLFSANMDGTNKEVFVYDMTEPDGITLDIQEKRIYWAEQNGIKSVQLDGRDKKTIYHHTDKMEKFRSITVFQDYYAYTNGESMVYYGLKSDGTNTDPRPIQHINSMVSHDIISYSPYLQPRVLCNGPNCVHTPCQLDNGGCDHLCLPTSGTTKVCKCGNGFRMAKDGMRCLSDIVDKHFMLIVDPFHRQIYQLNLEDDLPELQGVPISTSDFPTIIDLDIVNRDVIWLDKSANVILKAPLPEPDLDAKDTRRKKRQAMDEQLVHVVPEDTTVNYFVVSSKSREIVYSDLKTSTIFKVSLNKNKKTTFSINSPAKYMTLDESTGELYWVEESGRTSYIYSKNVYKTSGNKRKLRDSITIVSISVDYNGGMLYWCTKSQIMRSNNDGTNANVFLDYQGHDYDNVAVSRDHIYFSFIDRKALYRIDRHGNVTTMEAVTDNIFSRISNIKDYSWIEERAKYKDYTQEPTEPIKVEILAGVISAVVALLLIALCVAIALWKGLCRKKLPKSDFEVEAHENPTYMTTKEVQGQTSVSDPVYYTLPGGGAIRPASAGSRDSDLPDVVKLPLPDEAEPGIGPNVSNERVVRPSEVVMKVGAQRTLSVKYNK
jgi:sugar lactone lactonase YvrE